MDELRGIAISHIIIAALVLGFLEGLYEMLRKE
jgi:hypothetical protein